MNGQTVSIKGMLTDVGIEEPQKLDLPRKQDLRKFFLEIEDQDQLGSCTAQAGVGLVEYFERRTSGKHMDASRLFLYKATRNLLRWNGDRGAYLRTTMGALRLFGVPPEEYWPYEIDKFDQEPPAFCYAFAQNFQAIQYYRLDMPLISKKNLLAGIKSHLAAGLPAMFGFTVYNSINQVQQDGEIPFPVPGDRVVGGHAVDAVGYDDDLKISNSAPGSTQTKGALLIRNSWGTGWGMQGYGWLPYEYILQGLAVDWCRCLRTSGLNWENLAYSWTRCGKLALRLLKYNPK